MDELRMKQLQEELSQMVRLRNDSSLLQGFSFNTVAGDIRISRQRTAISMLDYYIKELQTEIKDEM